MTEEKDFGMTGGEIFTTLLQGMEASDEDEVKLALNYFAHIQMLWLHSRALAAHCECLGMNAENSLAVCGNYIPPYNDGAYFQVMQKWGLIDEKGEPII